MTWTTLDKQQYSSLTEEIERLRLTFMISDNLSEIGAEIYKLILAKQAIASKYE